MHTIDEVLPRGCQSFESEKWKTWNFRKKKQYLFGNSQTWHYSLTLIYNSLHYKLDYLTELRGLHQTNQTSAPDKQPMKQLPLNTFQTRQIFFHISIEVFQYVIWGKSFQEFFLPPNLIWIEPLCFWPKTSASLFLTKIKLIL